MVVDIGISIGLSTARLVITIIRLRRIVKILIIFIIIVIIGVVLYIEKETLRQGLFVNCHDLTKIQICYPQESLFYPYPFLSLIGIGIINFIFFLSIAWVSNFLKRGPFPKSSDAISAVGVGISMVVLFIPYIILTPILNYDIKKVNIYNDSMQLNIIITNYGIATAKHVLLSIQQDKNNVKFQQITSEPIQKPIQLYSKTNDTGNVFFVIDALPSRGADTTIKVNLATVQNSNPTLTTYVRSDETIGYHNILYMGVIYLLLLVPIVIWIIRTFISQLLSWQKSYQETINKSKQ